MRMIKMKKMIREQPEKEPSLKLMDIIQLVLNLEDGVIEIKKKLKELQPKVYPDSGGKKIDPKFFNKDVIDDLPKKRPE
jgi:hypothetical protein|tara:strand:- start:392 stop:628 length:237 start_codon:yes stop_codon:yes gene_type:complete